MAEHPIRTWMRLAGIRQIEISGALGIDGSRVSRAVNGKDPNKRVYEWLREKGCPPIYFKEMK